jgi:hypothetical protein
LNANGKMLATQDSSSLALDIANKIGLGDEVAQLKAKAQEVLANPELALSKAADAISEAGSLEGIK